MQSHRLCFSRIVAAGFLALAAPLYAEEGPVAKLPPAATSTVDFARDIQPLFQKNCYSCHGPEHQEGGLRLDAKKRALEGGDSGAEITPGKSADSRLIRVVAGMDEDFGLMPPEGKGTPLSAEQIGLLRAWIDQGATWPDATHLAESAPRHWSLQPVARPGLPDVQERAWLREPIDAFVLARLEKEKIRHSLAAAPTTILRRIYLDLVGLPPAPHEIEAYLADTRPDRLEREIDKLLASPHFGERWGRHWLDLARYADSDGYEKDRPRPFAWKFRDWVIDALNADMPYDQFTVEQIAGDLLPDATMAQRTASGFHRNTLHNTEGGIDPEEDRVKKTIDRTNTLGAVWLGLTLGCAQCHTHKYDSITQREYYGFYAFFNSLEEKDLENPTPEQAAQFAAAKKKHARRLKELRAELKAYEAEKLTAAQSVWESSLAGASAEALAEKKLPAEVAAALQKPTGERSAEESDKIAKHYRTLDAELAKLEKTVQDHQAKAPKLSDEVKVQAVAELTEPRQTNVLLRGDFLSPGDLVEPGTLAVLPPLTSREETPNRIDLAEWLVAPENPLPARVAVNRFWHRLFGRGIVPTVDDFGKQGDPPSHPELLDWLAAEISSQGWSRKGLLRRIVLSSAYQQSSAPRHDLDSIDPENVLVARQVRRRVEAEVIRDLALATSGLLNPHVGGPSVRPPQPAEYSSVTYANSARWAESKGGDRYRRGLYTFFQRTSPYPMLLTFDSPDSNECAASRQTSNTPLQALTLWNDPVFFETAQAFGRRIVAEVPAASTAQQTARERAAHAFLVALGRKPTGAELADVAALYGDACELAASDPAAAQQLVGDSHVANADERTNLAAWIVVARTLLNLDEFITRE